MRIKAEILWLLLMLVFGVILICFGVQFVRLGSRPQPMSALKTSAEHGVIAIDLSIATNDNVAGLMYVPLNLPGTPSKHVKTIQAVLTAFDATYRERVRTDWKLDMMQEKRAADSYIFGVWIDHKPRE